MVFTSVIALEIGKFWSFLIDSWGHENLILAITITCVIHKLCLNLIISLNIYYLSLGEDATKNMAKPG